MQHALDWEEVVPLMASGHHQKLADLAYGSGEKVFPYRENVFAAFSATPFSKVKVVIIGQDPYFNEHSAGPEAHGLAFSVRHGIPCPPSLRNIFKEINTTVYGGGEESHDSDLTRWAEQGVLLINATLTVIAGQTNSHAKLGWQSLTDDVIGTISREHNGVVFMLWGGFAQKKRKLIDESRHLVLATSHPSPLSSYRGFLGSGVFVECNNYLVNQGARPIVW